MSAAGKAYGNFLVEGPLDESRGGVYLARQRGTAGSADYVLKIVPLPSSTRAEPDGLAARKLDAIALQDRVAADWNEVVAPILDRPAKVQEVREALSQGEAWFVTRRYDLTLEGYLKSLNGAPPPGEFIRKICRAMTRGSLAFKQAGTPGGGRRSHGNLKPSNVLICGIPFSLKSEVVVTDPALGARADQTDEERRELEESSERSDLASIGRILFQLVAGKPLPESWNWSDAWNSPEGKLGRWRKVFGDKGGKWRELCQKLLAPEGGGERLTLTGLETALANLPVADSALTGSRLVLLLLVAGLIGAALFLARNKGREGRIVIQSNIEELEVVVTRGGDSSAPVKAKLSPGGETGQFIFRAKPGTYQLEVTPGGQYSRLASRIASVELAPGKDEVVAMEFGFATVEFTSTPGAEVEWLQPGKPPALLGRTPFKTVMPAGGFYFVFTNAGYLNKSVWADLTETNLVTAALERQFEGDLTLDLRSEVDRRFRRSVFLLDDRETDRFISFKPNREYTLKVIPPMPWPALETNIVLPGHSTNFVYAPPHGTVFLDYRDPALSKASVWFLGADQEGKLGVVGEEVFRLPPGSHELQFELPGLVSSTTRVEVRPGGTNIVRVRLELPPVALTLITSLDGARVTTNGRPAGEVGPQAGQPLLLQPNVEHQVEITFSNALGRLPREQIRIRGTPGQQITTNVSLKYGIVMFEPQPTNAVIRSEGTMVPSRLAVQAPGRTVQYEISALNHEPATNAVAVQEGDAKTIEVRLNRR
jgi:hypothetical protein